MTAMTIRPAHLDDARSIAELHVVVWRHTYHALAPAKAFVMLDEEHRFLGWHERLAAPGDGHVVMVAEGDNGLVGFTAAGEPSQPIFGERSEIKQLYVDPAHKRRGIGRALLAALADRLAGHGRKGAALGVVAGNGPAIAFYEALGARQVGSYTDPGPLWRSHNLAYAWDDLKPLIRREPAAP